jgi:AraC-like DNA-binding protein
MSRLRSVIVGDNGASTLSAPATPAAARDAEGSPVAGGFSEREAWRRVCSGWCPLFAGFRERGFSVEWHDFECPFQLDWARSFHPQSLEICLNLTGRGWLVERDSTVEVRPRSSVFYYCGSRPLPAWRAAEERHQFLTVELSREFIDQRLAETDGDVDPTVQRLLNGPPGDSAVAGVVDLSAEAERMVQALRQPPIRQAARPLWFESKVLEIIAHQLFEPHPENELFCDRQKRVARERVQRVLAVLEANLAEVPDLETLGRQVGCSPYHLSRTFSSETGLTIPQFLRQRRLERAGELLRSGRQNVTEAALAVGYSSLSHFSQAFREHFGCCPGLYPLSLPGQGLALQPASSGALEQATQPKSPEVSVTANAHTREPGSTSPVNRRRARG